MDLPGCSGQPVDRRSWLGWAGAQAGLAARARRQPVCPARCRERLGGRRGPARPAWPARPGRPVPGPGPGRQPPVVSRCSASADHARKAHAREVQV